MKPGKFWPRAIVGLLGMNVVVVAITVVAANSDGGAAVEPDYYRRALHWDDHVASLARQKELGWQVSVQVAEPDAAGACAVNLIAADRNGVPLRITRGQLECFHNGHAAEVQDVALTARGDGVLRGAASFARDGRWTFRVQIVSGVDTYQEQFERTISRR